MKIKNFLRFKTQIIKELRIVLKSIHGFLSMLVIMVAISFIYQFSLEGERKLEIIELAGLLWANVFILSFILIGQSMREERENGAFFINVHTAGPTIFFTAKASITSIFLLGAVVLEFLIFQFFFEKFSIGIWMALQLFALFIPGIFALSFLGVFLSLISYYTRFKEILLPLLLIPFSIPVLLYGIESAKNTFQTGSIYSSHFLVLSLFSILYFSLGVLFSETIPD